MTILERFRSFSPPQRVALLGGVALVVALAVVAWIYSRDQDYRVLFTNLAPEDGGAILASLQQQNIPYRLNDGGIILVPSHQVHETRLKLASQGLPRGGAVGFELLENQKMGVSQFLEQVNYHRALQGELARSIMSLAAVQEARVHLAIPKPTVFVREQQKPSASVVLKLYPGRTLDRAQIAGIMHLVASSVPELAPSAVTIIDQSSNLLSSNSTFSQLGLSASQLEYVQQVEKQLAERVHAIVEPIVGRTNVRAQVAAQLDFTQTEQTSESFKPNNQAVDQVIRAQGVKESQTMGATTVGGVPGALSNQPPGAATAPLNAPGQPSVTNSSPPPISAPQNTNRESITNYEVDKTIRHIKAPIGQLQRLSVAVVVNFRKLGEGDKAQLKPLSATELEQITNLVKDAVGYNASRGDTVNVVNAAFPKEEVTPPLPFYKDPEMVHLIKMTAQQVILAAILLVLFYMVVRPLYRKNFSAAKENETSQSGAEAAVDEDAATFGEEALAAANFDSDLKTTRELARQDPRLVAEIVRLWMNKP